MIKYIGVKNASEANQLNKDFIQAAQRSKKRESARKNIVAIAICCVIAAMAIFVYLNTELMWPAIIAVFGVIAFVAEFLIFKLTSKNNVENDEGDKPIAYQFFVATKGREILKADVVADQNDNNEASLYLEVKSRSGIIATECIRGFKLVNAFEAEDTVVDLDDGVIYVPEN